MASRKAFVLEISGNAASTRTATATAMAVRPTTPRLPDTSLDSFISSSITLAEAITTSARALASTRACTLGAEVKSTSTRTPVARSNISTTPETPRLMEPALSSRSAVVISVSFEPLSQAVP